MEIKDKIYINLERLESELDKSFPLIPFYMSIINTKKIKFILKELYNSMPIELKKPIYFSNYDEKHSLYKFLKTLS